MNRLKSQELLQLYLEGQDEAATEIFDRYVARLIALVRSRLGPKLKRRLDAEDVVQSAYRSFFLHAKPERYQLVESGDLWRLLAGIALNKLRGQIEKQTAAKRTVDREEKGTLSAMNLQGPEPSVGEAVAVAEELHLVLAQLSPTARQVLTSRLQGESIEEIGRAIGKSDRTVRRLLAETRRSMEQRLLVNDDSPAARSLSIVEPRAPLEYGNYVLEKLLSTGGMGKVFRARQVSSGRTVAFKALHKARQTDERSVAQFVQEAEVLAKLSHPNIVKVEGLGRFPSGGYFIVMEFIEGGDLESRLSQGPLPLVEAIQVVTKVAAAVQHAHEEGIIHCDIKPANVLVDRDDRVAVTDFGLAFMIVGTSSANAIGGTAGYIAPEILTQGARPTPAADVYALGVLLWRLATGKSPNDLADHHAVEESIAGLLSVCRHCVEEDPRQRYSTPQQFIEDLERVARA